MTSIIRKTAIAYALVAAFAADMPASDIGGERRRRGDDEQLKRAASAQEKRDRRALRNRKHAQQKWRKPGGAQ